MKKRKKKPPCDPTEVHNHPADCAYGETKTASARVWRTFLKIDSSLLKDKAPVADPLWLASQGMNEASPIVVELLRQHVRPLYAYPLQRLWFFVHNRESGVPTTEDDRNAYLDITLVYMKRYRLSLDAPFVMTRPHKLSKQCAGWNLKLLNPPNETSVEHLHDVQARMVMQFLDRFNKDADTMTILRHMRQYLHYLANVTQMRIA